jgi:ATP-dependent Clp protease protease subunit
VASQNENPPLMPAIMTPGGPLDLATVLLGNRIIFIGQYINSQVAQRVISQLVTLSAIDEEGDILVSVHFFLSRELQHLAS